MAVGVGGVGVWVGMAVGIGSGSGVGARWGGAVEVAVGREVAVGPGTSVVAPLEHAPTMIEMANSVSQERPGANLRSRENVGVVTSLVPIGLSSGGKSAPAL